MNRFWDEFSKSTIMSGLLALLVWGIIGYLAIVGREIPIVLATGGGAIIVFFYGAKSEASAARLQARLLKSTETTKPVPIAPTCDCDLID